MQTFKSFNSRGQSLVSMLIMIALIGMSVAAMSSMQTNGLKYSMNNRGNAVWQNIGNSLQLALSHYRSCETAFPGVDITPIVAASAGSVAVPVSVKLGDELIAGPGMIRENVTIGNVTLTEVASVQRTACGGGLTSYAMNLHVEGSKREGTYVGSKNLTWDQKVFVVADSSNQITGCAITDSQCGGSGGGSPTPTPVGPQQTGNLFPNGDFEVASPISLTMRFTDFAFDSIPKQQMSRSSVDQIAGVASEVLTVHGDSNLWFYWKTQVNCDPVLARATNVRWDFDAKILQGNARIQPQIEFGYQEPWHDSDRYLSPDILGALQAGGTQHFSINYDATPGKNLEELQIELFMDGTTVAPSGSCTYYCQPTSLMIDNVSVVVTYDPGKALPLGCP